MPVPHSVPAAAEHRRAAQHHGRDRVELVPGARVGLRLPEVRDVDDRRQARDQAGQHVDEPEPPRHRNAGVPRAGRGEADRVERAADRRSMEQHRVARRTRRRGSRSCAGIDAPEIALAEREKPRRESAVIDRAAGDRLGDAAEQRERRRA